MHYLLDTHNFLWFINDDKQLSRKAAKAIADTDAIKCISIASFWEISIKINIGKIELDMAFSELRQHMMLNGFELLPIKFEHTTSLCTLDLHHRDPFDRMIIAQALTENLVVVSKDAHSVKYKDLQLLW